MICRSVRSSPRRRDLWSQSISIYNGEAKAANLVYDRENTRLGYQLHPFKVIFLVDKQLLLDAPQRWDSTFVMIERFLLMKDVSALASFAVITADKITM